MPIRPFGQKYFLFILMLFFLSACGAPKALDNPGNPDQNAESSYCDQVQSYPSGVTISGRGRYQYRKVDLAYGLYGNPQTAEIPFAEIRVTSGGSTVQCGNTLADGTFSLRVPGSGNYTITISSRSDTAELKATVNADYYENRPHSISKTVSVGSASYNAGDLVAKARVSESSGLEGGAFNILAQLYRANEYLRSALGNMSFVAPKVKVYWRKGYNPYSYFGYPNTLLSFYRPGTGELFILGGTGGVVHNVDTDHFDNSVILHEYGHFLEDVYSVSDSPGGSHDGNSILDPRLAWSEGWANFFQGAVLRHNVPAWTYGNSGGNLSGDAWAYYVDTKGFSGDTVETTGVGKILITANLTGSGFPYQDPVSSDGEGTFREMSISRFLFKTLTTAGIDFLNLWRAFSTSSDGGITSGFASPNVAFRNVGTFNQYLQQWITRFQSDQQDEWDDVLVEEKQNKDSRSYADRVSTASSCSARTMTPKAETTDQWGSYSNQFHSNHFYRFEHDGTAKNIRLVYSNRADTGSAYRNLDLHLYKEDYVYQESDEGSNGTMARSSARSPTADGGTETIDLSGLSKGTYLINVKAYAYNISNFKITGSMSYDLYQIKGSTTEYLCPEH